ncbi:MAG: glycosyltransferase [Micromonosporaceae bacterium]|nr:glycosyltransferase [Micromonosporaceae bacterium]
MSPPRTLCSPRWSTCSPAASACVPSSGPPGTGACPRCMATTIGGTSTSSCSRRSCGRPGGSRSSTWRPAAASHPMRARTRTWHASSRARREQGTASNNRSQPPSGVRQRMGLLSVVLPIYNVEDYLPEALESLANQTHRELEVVMVDDGSTDRSAELAAEVAGRDPRFRLVQQDNHGLGHARNTGMRLAIGEFITFVDSDDIVPHYACRTVVRTLEVTGSDFLSGNEYRIDSRGASPAPMLESNFAVTRLRTNVAKRRSLMRDLLPHNKVYRRAFWDAAGLEFPEGILFEDGPVSVRAHALAKSVDVVSTPIYYWRLRDDASRSLSQLFDDERFFVDRLYASTLSADFLEAHRPDLLGDFYSWDIQHKFPVMFKALPQAPRAVQERFMQAAVPHLRRIPPEVIRALPPGLRRRAQVTGTDDLDALLNQLPRPKAAAAAAQSGRSTLLDRGRAVAVKSRTLRAIGAFARVTPSNGNVRSAVMELGRDGDGLRLAGYGYIVGLPANGPLTARNRLIWARHQESRRLVRLRLRGHRSPEATAVASGHFSYRAAGFEAVLPLADLKDPAGRWRYGTWLLALGAWTTRGVARSGLRIGPEAYRTDPLPITLDEDTRLIPTVTNGVLGFRIEESSVAHVQCRVEGSQLVITGRVAGAVDADATAALGRVAGVPELPVPVQWWPVPDGHASFTARVALPELVEAVSPVAATPVAGNPDRLHFGLRRHAGDLAWQQFACEPGFAGVSASVAEHHVAVAPAGDGYLAVTVRPPGPVVTAASWSADGLLRLDGAGADQVRQFQLIGRHSSNTERRPLPYTTGPDGTWQVRLDPEAVPLVGAAPALRAGQWRLVLRTTDAAGAQADVDLPYAPEIFTSAGQSRVAYRDRYWLKPLAPDGLALRINSRLPVDERGTYHTARLRSSVYLASRTGAALRDVVLYDSFNGKQYSDAPRAVHEELSARGADLEHVWVTRDGQAPVPAGTRTVEANSREWFEALATSRYLVANTHLPAWLRRREGQVVAQTWHGIGFKRVAFDMDSVQFANPGYLAKLEQEAPNWSFLVSPSSFCTEIMRRAFRYDGEICEVGSPRNDVLFTGDRAELTARVHRALGIEPGRKILLYAPTWRDNEFYGPGRYKFDMRLDVSQFPGELQQEYALLVRRHPNTVDDLLGQDSDFVFDVANYPDVRDLLAAADVLVTDYSTISLDFLNTGRPVLYYTYDLASYRDSLRGFYFDLEGEGPGPVLETTGEVVGALQDLDAVQDQYRERYEKFRQVYCHAEDGHATARVVDRLLRGRSG